MIHTKRKFNIYICFITFLLCSFPTSSAIANYWTPTILTHWGIGGINTNQDSFKASQVGLRYEISPLLFISTEYAMHFSHLELGAPEQQRLSTGLNIRFDLLQLVPWSGLHFDYIYTPKERASVESIQAGATLGVDYLLSEALSFTLLSRYSYSNTFGLFFNVNYRFKLGEDFDRF